MFEGSVNTPVISQIINNWWSNSINDPKQRPFELNGCMMKICQVLGFKTKQMD